MERETKGSGKTCARRNNDKGLERIGLVYPVTPHLSVTGERETEGRGYSCSRRSDNSRFIPLDSPLATI